MKKVYIVSAVRTPLGSFGGALANVPATRLGAAAIKGALEKAKVQPGQVEEVFMGNVYSANLGQAPARQAAIYAGIPNTVPCTTVNKVCSSGAKAIMFAAQAIMLGHQDIIVAGGMENMSSVPYYVPKARYGYGYGHGELVDGMVKDGLTDAYNQAVMGVCADNTAKEYNISREEQDAFAVRSHQLAAKAFEQGYLPKEMTEVSLPPDFTPISRDNGVRGDSTIESVSKLRPAFDKKFGTLTAANSSFLTDGAAACLIMSEEKAKELGFTPKVEVVDFVFTGQRLEDELLLGPTYAVSKLLKRQNMELKDIDVIEFHEAFAGQILSNLKALASDEFAQQNLGRDKAVGTIDMSKFNLWGGSLSIGHPFGATGARIATTTANRLQKENGKYGLLAACAAGAHGHAMLLKRWA